jgi:hypothetical protein
LEFLPRLAGVDGIADAALSSYAASDAFWQRAFFTPIGDASEPLVLGDQVLVLLPLDETAPDESQIDSLKGYFEYIVQSYARQIEPFFTQSPRLKDQFWETYSRYFMN